MGCQKSIVSDILNKEGEYIVCVKGNQGHLLEDVKALFRNETERKHKRAKEHQDIDKNHGRMETRLCRALPCPEAFLQKDRWAGLQSLVQLKSTREIGDKTTHQIRYFLTSLPPNPTLLLSSIRSHWGIENSLHWVLDVAFSEDLSRVRKDHAPLNLATLRRIAFTLLKQETSASLGISSKRTQAAWSTPYLLKILQI